MSSLSKITITSTRATCTKNSINRNLFVFNYYENVTITFADKSTITAQQLEIIFEGKAFCEKNIANHTVADTKKGCVQVKQNPLEKFKKITASGNVVFNSKNRTAKAKKAELYLAEHLCNLIGDVTIQQKKIVPKDIPITIESEQATINFRTDELTFAGSDSNPVSTVISIEHCESLNKKKGPHCIKKNE